MEMRPNNAILPITYNRYRLTIRYMGVASARIPVY